MSEVAYGSDDIERMFVAMGVLRTGHFRLSSGNHSDTYLQCALALREPVVAMNLGRWLAARVEHLDVDVVVSPALGGVLAGFVVAAALERPFLFTERGADRTMTLRRGQQLERGQRVLVVEDVVTTGGSAREAADACTAEEAEVVGFAALVDRSGGLPSDQRPHPPPIALLHVEPATWTPQDCPRCAAGIPLDTPGSRHTST